MKLPWYKIYRQFIPLLFLPLIATALTGIVYGIGDRFLTLPNIVVDILIFIHKGQFLGIKLVPIYVLLMGLGTFLICLVTLIDSGDNSSEAPSSSFLSGVFYRPLVLILIIPLALCVETGVAYQLGKDWFGMSEQKTASFLSIHGGSSLGTFLGSLYTIITGFSLIALAIVGYRMVATSAIQRRQKQQNLSQQIAITTSSEGGNSSIDRLASLRSKIQLGVILFSLVLMGIVYFGTTKLFASIVTIVIIFVIPALVIAEKLIQLWQQQKERQTQFYEQEAESITILRAIPDSMLIVSNNGICLSYMPAKEAKFFVLDGDIIQKHLTDFLAPEIARQFFKYSQLSLSTGSTRLYRFPVSIDGKQQYHEARISPIGQTEVLIMVREITDIKDVLTASEQQSPHNNSSIKLLTESEFVTLLDGILQNHQDRERNHIMFCLAIEQTETNNHNSFNSNDRIIEQITTQITSYLPLEAIARIDEDELIILLEDIPSENISALIVDLHHSLNHLTSNNDNKSSVKFNLGLLRINADSPDVVSLMNLAKATFKMAKQKVNVKTFW